MTKASSSGCWRQFTGQNIAPISQQATSSSWSRKEFWPSQATRSPGRTPASRSALAHRWTRAAASGQVSARSPSANAIVAGRVRACARSASASVRRSVDTGKTYRAPRGRPTVGNAMAYAGSKTDAARALPCPCVRLRPCNRDLPYVRDPPGPSLLPYIPPDGCPPIGCPPVGNPCRPTLLPCPPCASLRARPGIRALLPCLASLPCLTSPPGPVTLL